MRRKVHCWQCDTLAVPTMVIIEQVTSLKQKREFCHILCAAKWLKGLADRCRMTALLDTPPDEVAPTNPVRSHP